MLRACRDSGAGIIRGADGSWVNKELLMIPQECFTQFDISQPGLKDAIPEKHFDLTISSEVAEHIDPNCADIFMDNLTSFSEVILFSAAIPGQGGTHHVNEQWPSYWIEKFSVRGFIPIDCIRPYIWHDDSVRLDYRQNLILLVHRNALKKYPALDPESRRPVIDAVHAKLWENVHSRKRSFKTNCRMLLSGFADLIPSFIRAVIRRIHKH